MKILYISRSASGKPHPFIEEQAAALGRSYDVCIQHFIIHKGGLVGYMRAINKLIVFLNTHKIDLIHAHYGLSALVAAICKTLYFKEIPIVITYHGSDINKASERGFSLIAARFATHNIVVSDKMRSYFENNCSVIPCGVDTDVEFRFRESARKHNGWGKDHFVILFSSSFKRKEKDPEFAKEVIQAFSQATSKSVVFLELQGYSRKQLTKLMQAADALILCSKREGSPQVIKEAILNTLPVISNDVGDVKLICSEADNCYIISKRVNEYVKILQHLSRTYPRIYNREPVIEQYSNNLIAAKLYHIYLKALKSESATQMTQLHL